MDDLLEVGRSTRAPGSEGGSAVRGASETALDARIDELVDSVGQLPSVDRGLAVRLLLLAGVTGLAIAAALLGIGLHQTESASAPMTETEQRAALGPEGMTVNKHRARTPSAHQAA